MNKNILYISYHYPPSNSIGSTRSYNQVLALREMGHNVKVLHGTNNEARYITNTNHIQHTDDIPINLKAGAVNQFYNQSLSIKYFIVNYFPKKLVSIFLNMKLLIFGEEKNWDNESNFNSALSLLGDFKPDLLISTSGPIENHIFCSRFKAYYNSYWVGEYRDSWSYDPMQPGSSPSDFSSKILRIKERRIINKIDLVLAVSPIIHKYYQSYFKKRSYLIFSGWLESKVKLPKPQFIHHAHKDKIKILHLGSMLLGKRSPLPIIDLFEEDSALRDSFDIFFIGRDTTLYNSYLLETKHAKSSINLIPEVDFHQARAEGLNADILLLLMMNDPGEKHVVTGKIYEYIYLNKPIIIIDSNQSQASQLITKYQLGYVCKSISEFQDLMHKISKLGRVELESNDAREQFNVMNTMKDFMAYIENGK